ncbi:MAG: hypothetical protein UX85_C0001G0201 [Candidatus Beckwithbacteria bacterium GW2011_GWB1_47_15]|uniref:Ribbon-helix-helix protein CopG domain-containing protein n=1 Tax=Candidatus Beckwithbacteria bacterium GW2011_GWB1_47_15 TaxID=1618371 RepID=A0A0G1RXZ7_9BACT|nr:hypothetical protein [uncultured bacterium]KKU36023.1 MAG: hypothetical protein UX50_C0001G0200 [Candidatus Beckwithbacteria bacterium GW2011_GWA1_46_30]KKU61987.1 MAG: hypothetical protein UX85_C0001G0201 [Candidatus Beckwithbacteria bacterium GW2011_GWB1_47_15]KKU72459.1 MAG: hypothetical protein UX97_C0001G0329 [Candidatus Beckwithbacteria bacterium GW2011_GWA2_47_25]KKW04374.1 MAG: hypothetical protein UY37_C0003G0205 [Candidatus Beckwithbacteria bacterium GW2011_GWC2_49_11]
MYNSNMIRTQIYIPDELHQDAKNMARRQEQSLARLLRRLIAKGLKEEKRKLKPKSLASLARLKITTGPKDLSKNMDKYLYAE